MSSLASHFAGGRDYLAACTLGLPSRETVRAVRADLDAAASGRPDVVAASQAVEKARAAYARLVSSPVGDVAIGSQTSVQVALIAASVPDGAEVLCAEGDFSSLVAPFARAGRGIRLRTAPLDDLAAAITPGTWLVAFSLVQSATGEVADAAGIAAAARARGHPHAVRPDPGGGVAAGGRDDVRRDRVPRLQVAVLPARGVLPDAHPDFADEIRPVQAGWYSGDDPWSSCYGTGGDLAPTRDASTSRPRGRPSSGRRPLSRCSRRPTSPRPTCTRRASPRGSATDSDCPSVSPLGDRHVAGCHGRSARPAHRARHHGIRARGSGARGVPRLQRRARRRPGAARARRARGRRPVGLRRTGLRDLTPRLPRESGSR